MLSYFLNPLIAAVATTLFTLLFVFSGVHEIATLSLAYSQKKVAKGSSCCDHPPAAPAFTLARAQQQAFALIVLNTSLRGAIATWQSPLT